MSSKKRRPILMGEAERVVTATEPPCPTPITRAVFNRASIGVPDDEAVSLTPKCHRESGMKVWYLRSDGTVALICAECGAGVAFLLLAVDVPS